MKLIDEEYTKHPFYGTRRMRTYLRNQGYLVNRKQVQRLYRFDGIGSGLSEAKVKQTKFGAQGISVFIARR